MNKPFQPYIATGTKVPEFSLRAIILGMLLGLIFGVGNAYLGLKVGTTVSASIPAAVLSMAILSLFSKRVSILENNIVQTVASVGEGLAAGVIFTAPALFLLGAPPSVSRMMLLSGLGAILGILFMIPMRRYIIVEEHGKLPFPEGTACAEILKTRQGGRSKALTAVTGIVVGSIYKILSGVLSLWQEIPCWTFKKWNNFTLSIDCTPALLGVGYIIGFRVCSFLLFGGLLAWWVMIPLISMFGQGDVIVYPGTIPIAKMSADEIWSHYIRFIGAGAVGIGGLFNLVKIVPVVRKTVRVGFQELFEKKHNKKVLPRTDRDISLRWLVVGSLAIILFLWLFPGLPMNFLTIVLLVVIAFFFVAVTSITVGLVGSTSNPVSGMTITTLLITCLIFVALGWTERMYLIAALTMSIVVNVAIALAGATSQDLKTGYLLGATPKAQQVGEIIGTILPALAIGGTLYLLNNAYGFGSQQLPAPQASLMALVAQGVILKNIPFLLVFIGIMIGILTALVRVPVLPVAIGLYLPLSLSTGVMVGGIVSWVVHKMKKTEETAERGVLASSGLVAGDACTGVVIAALIVFTHLDTTKPSYFGDEISLLIYGLLAMGLVWIAYKPPAFLRKL